MAEETTNTTPDASKSNNKSMMIVGVVALLAIGGIILYNQMTKTPADKAKEAVEQQATDLEKSVEQGTKETANEAEDVAKQGTEVMEEKAQLDEEKMELKETTTKNLVEVATEAKTFTTLLTALKTVGLDKVLATGGPYTVFAPNEEAFKKLPAGTLESLLKDPTKLADILKYHVVSGKVMSSDIKNGTQSPTLQGAKVSFTVNPDGTVTVNGAKVVKADVNAANGVIHVVDTVLIPSPSGN
jgi:uncharacterized surface protein with fasciclin (FAS1) repeats